MSALEKLLILLVTVAAVAGAVWWIGADRRRFAQLAAAAVGLTFIVIVAGAFVRLSDAGLGCPDWPGCYGDLSPAHAAERIAAEERANPLGPVTFAKAWKEMVHRYIAALLGALIIGLAVAAWRHRARWQASPWLATAIVGVVMLQGAFGAWTVTMLLKPAIVTGHLIGGMLTLSLLAWLALRAHAQLASQPNPVPLNASAVTTLRPLALGALCIVATQIVLGGWVSTNYAALACPDFPMCQGQLVPDTNFADAFHLLRKLGMTAQGEPLPYDALATIHWVHRAFAMVVAAGVGLLAWRLRTHTELKQSFSQDGLMLLIALAAQIGLGISNVVFNLPLAIAVAHNAGAAILLLCLVALNHKLALAAASSPVNQPQMNWRPCEQ